VQRLFYFFLQVIVEPIQQTSKIVGVRQGGHNRGY
jgi:hypothetical protein